MLPGPNVESVQKLMRLSPIYEMLANYIDLMGPTEIRWIMGLLAVATHLIMGLWFIVTIVGASEDWKSDEEEEEVVVVKDVDAKTLGSKKVAEKAGADKAGKKDQ
ncbi:hypothetical protein HDU98_009894 [Podochytrium sp. JEL0797]|nr:hypothetical protein HDU98_009894 [Podochytrium sp. JEL0797]